jgi:hypothetical protein
MTRRASALAAALSVVAAVVVAGTPRAGAATCATSAPPSGAFSATVCIGGVSPGDRVSGDTTVTVTVSVTPASAVKHVKLFIGAEYVATDLASPWSVVIPTQRWADGSHTIKAEAVVKNGTGWWTSAKTSLAVEFSNPQSASTVPFAAYEPRGLPGGTFTIAAVGDGAAGRGASTAVVSRIDGWNPDVFLYLGDVYARGTFTEFRNWYGDGSTWFSRFDAITNPVLGNHEYAADPSAVGYRDYWGDPPHRYAYDVGAWHLIALDSTAEFGQVAPGTAQYDWLIGNLHDAPACTLVYFHHPVYSAGAAPVSRLTPLWRLLADEGVDVVLSGHEHRYERWKPMDADGELDAAGPTEYVVGTGGMSLYRMSSVPSRIAAWSDAKYGALRLALSPGSVASTFVTSGGAVLDTATRSCSPPVDHDPPSAPVLDASATSPDTVELSWSASTDDIGVVSYTVLRDGAAIASLGPEATTYTDDGRQPETDYDYVVKARDAAGHTTASNVASATTPPVPDTTPPEAPPNLTALALDATTVVLDWDDAVDDRAVVDYVVRRDGEWLGVVVETAYTDTTATPGSTYTYTVRARDAVPNVSDPSSVEVSTPDAVPPSLIAARFAR